jgi:putative transcription factor
MECEICGKKTTKIFITEIEGTVLRLCKECSKSGKILNVVEEKEGKEERKRKEILTYEEDWELVENYGRIVREARSKLGLSIEELAKGVGEKESLIRRIEREEIRPSDKVIDKLERFLKVKLKEKVKRWIKKNDKQIKAELRIADVIKIKG